MFWPTLTHYGWAVSIRTAGQFVALQVDSFHHNGWRYWVRIRTEHGTYPSFDGHLEAMSDVISHAPLADSVADYFDGKGTHPGVWLYEVAEPFGEALAMHLHAGTLGARNGQSIAADLLRDIMASVGYDVQELAAAFSVVSNGYPEPHGQTM
jgi:hypothetical protein